MKMSQNLLDQGGKEIAKLLDDGKPNEALARLYYDYSELLTHREGSHRLKELLTSIDSSDIKGRGWDLVITGTSTDASVSMIKPEHNLAGFFRTGIHAVLPAVELGFGAKNEKALFKVTDDLVIPYSGRLEVDADRENNFVSLGAGFAEASAQRSDKRVEARLRNLAKTQLPELQLR